MPGADRMSRKGYALLLAFGLTLVGSYIAFKYYHGWGNGGGASGGLAAVLLLSCRGRMHDLGYGTAWAVLPAFALTFAVMETLEGPFFPVAAWGAGAIGLTWLALMLFMPGQPGSNRYGPPVARGLRTA